MRNVVKLLCPYCRVECTAGFLVDHNQTPCIMHPQPACESFMKDEPLDAFLKKAREAMAN